MSDQTIIDEAVSCHRFGVTINDLQAKVIANAYHSGMFSRFYMLASTGTINNEDGQLGRELEGAERIARIDNNVDEINALKSYIIAKGTRGPQDNWSNLNW